MSDRADYPPASPPLPPQRTSPWAIASLLCAIGIACPLLALLAPLLGLKAISHIRSTPGTSGMRMAVAGIVIGLVGIGLWASAAYIWHVEVRTPLLRGPAQEFAAGFAGDTAAFKAGFTERGAAATDEEALLFLNELSTRFGRLISIQQDVHRPDSEPGRMSDVIPYVLHFDTGLIQAEARLVLFADGVSPKWEYIVILDEELGDISYPPGVRRLPEPARADAEDGA